MDLQPCLQHSKDEYFAAALTDIQNSIVVAQTQTRRTVELVVGVEQFNRVVQMVCEHFDTVVTAICDPETPFGIHDK